MFLAYSAIFTRLDMFVHIRVYFYPHSGTFRYSVYSESWHSLFMYIKAYSEPMAYSGIFRTVDISNQFQTLLKSNSYIL